MTLLGKNGRSSRKASHLKLCAKRKKRIRRECKRRWIRRKNYAVEVKRLRTEERKARSCVTLNFAIHFSSLQSFLALQIKIEQGGKILLLGLFQGACIWEAEGCVMPCFKLVHRQARLITWEHIPCHTEGFQGGLGSQYFLLLSPSSKICTRSILCNYPLRRLV